MSLLNQPAQQVYSFGKIYEYPNGTYDIIASSAPIFKEKGWEDQALRKVPAQQESVRKESRPKKDKSDKEDLERARRRARAKVRRLALANEFRWFVTLTLDPSKVDSMDVAAVTRKLNQWCSNQVKRKDLRYILVPEFHKSGRVHYHGFFSDSLEAVDSGTITGVPGAKGPRKPRSKAQRAEWLEAGGKVVYNLPGWAYGFTTAIELYGEYERAVAYVCKYIGKDSEKIGGRWYYSGGNLQTPVEKFVDISAEELMENFDHAWSKQVPGALFAGVNGLKGETDNA